jgi:hypothetical protein
MPELVRAAQGYKRRSTKDDVRRAVRRCKMNVRILNQGNFYESLSPGVRIKVDIFGVLFF